MAPHSMEMPHSSALAASSTGNMDMNHHSSNMNMNHGSTGGGGMDEPMVMTFFVSPYTPLFSAGWRPQTATAYIATCIFLVAIAALMRFVLAMKPILESTVWRHDNVSAVPTHEPLSIQAKGEEEVEPLNENGPLLARAGQQSYAGVKNHLRSRWRRWSASRNLARAAFEFLLASLGYLVMLAVMTMNVGYFLAVLVGVFLGTFALGDLASPSSLYEDQHC